MDEARRQILTLVARGEMEPRVAAERLADLDQEPIGSGASPEGGPPPGAAHAPEEPAPNGPADASAYTVNGNDGAPGTRIRVDASVRSVVIVGDSDVATAVADGPHTADWDGDTLVISEDHRHAEGFQFDWQDRPLRFRGRELLRARTLKVRMNPALPLDCTVSAGALSVRQVHAPITVTVAAGSARIEDFDGPLSLNVSAGSVTARGRLTEGQSRIDCDAGSVSLALLPGSSVVIRARSDLGKVSLPGWQPTESHGWLLGGAQEATVGGGRGELDIRVNMGAVSVTA